MTGTILFFALAALSCTAHAFIKKPRLLRESILTGFVLWGTGIALSTEILSLCQGITSRNIMIFWLAVLAVAIGMIISRRSALTLEADTSPWDGTEKFALPVIILTLTATATIAFFGPANTYDSMTYHMSRVMHWIQNRSLEFYPTHIPRQLYYSPFPEYIILHFQLLNGTDRWANFAQWLSMSGCLIAVSLIAKELGARRIGQLLAALFAITIPMGILQATSTQTDHVSTLWLSIFIYFLLRWKNNPSARHTLTMGACLGLGILSKGTFIIFSAPFLIWTIILAVHPKRSSRVGMILLMLAMACTFYSGAIYRSTTFFHGNAMGAASADADSLLNDQFNISALVANLLRNTGLHLSTPWENVNQAIQKTIYNTAATLHIELNHKDWSYIGASFVVTSFRYDEDITGNILHFILYGLAMLLMFTTPRLRKKEHIQYFLALLGAWLIFSGLLKWQPWHSRFHLPIFVIFAPLAGIIVERLRSKWIRWAIMLMLTFSLWGCFYNNVTKPVVGGVNIFQPGKRSLLYFSRKDPVDYLEYKTATDHLQQMGCKDIGLILGEDAWEYPFWTMLNPSTERSVRIEHVNVKNASGKLPYPLGDFSPCAVIALNYYGPAAVINKTIYPEIEKIEVRGKKISILLKSPFRTP